MQCDICKKTDATIHLTQILDGKMLKVDLCETCAKAKGVQDSGGGFSLSDLVLGFGESEKTQPETPGAKCAGCGLTEGDFKKTGRLGCAMCWETFATGLASLLKAMHKGDHHVGKVPGKAAHTVVIQDQIKSLSDELDEAIRSEKYETAAGLRDQIRELQGQLKVAVTKG
jgi:protein arginine kinase activator